MIPAYKVKVEGREAPEDEPTTYTCFVEAIGIPSAVKKIMRWTKKGEDGQGPDRVDPRRGGQPGPMKIANLRDDQLRHAIQCGDCKMDGVDTVILCGKGEQMGDSKRSLRDELARRDREKHRAAS